jgi:endonuclease/exonuclease/phosphatase family metal-dependent hydrolase
MAVSATTALRRARIVAVLREVRCDVVALQEVASLALHGEFLRQLRDALGLHVVTARTLTRRKHRLWQRAAEPLPDLAQHEHRADGRPSRATQCN